MSKFIVTVMSTQEFIQEWEVEAEDEEQAEAEYFKGMLIDESFNDTIDEYVDEVVESDDA